MRVDDLPHFPIEGRPFLNAALTGFWEGLIGATAIVSVVILIVFVSGRLS